MNNNNNNNGQQLTNEECKEIATKYIDNCQFRIIKDCFLPDGNVLNELTLNETEKEYEPFSSCLEEEISAIQCTFYDLSNKTSNTELPQAFRLDNGVIRVISKEML